MSDDSELRPAYRTLNDPTRLLGIPLSGWATLIVVGGAGYAWLMVSPLPWRANVSLVMIGLGAPAGLLILREQATVGPLRLLLAVIRWRARPRTVIAPSEQRPVRRGGICLDAPSGPLAAGGDVPELPWASDDGWHAEPDGVGEGR